MSGENRRSQTGATAAVVAIFCILHYVREMEVYMKRPEESASAFIDEKIKELGDWRGENARVGARIPFPAPFGHGRITCIQLY